MVELYYHQKKQLEFIKNKIPGKLPISIQSPTGSGKTFVILQFCKDYFEAHKNEDITIVITTGINKLVFQFAEECKKFNLNPIVLMGKQLIQDSIKIKNKYNLKEMPNINDYHAFGQDPELYLDKPIRYCNKEQLDLFYQMRSKLKSFGPKLIITNNTSYLLGLKYNQFIPNICIVDESHTFNSFYESFLKLEITSSEIKEIQKYLTNSGPTLMLFNKAIENKKIISNQLFNKIKEKLLETDISRELVFKLEEYAKTKPSIDNFIEINKSGIFITKFWTKFDINQENIQYILFSATQDSFTLDMFGVYKNRRYFEYSVKTIDYSKSEFLVIPEEKFEISIDKFLKYMKDKNKNNGLILSTTLVDVDYLMSKKNIHGFNIYNNIKEFQEKRNNEKCILVGSRALFQGIDLPGLDFVAINRIPFPTFNDKFKAQSKYLKEVGRLDPWTQFTMPIVINDIIQSTGRLWRNKEDKGVIAIFDPRLEKRFKYMKKYILDIRKGIKEINYEDLNI